MEAFGFKVVAIALIFLISLFGGRTPLWLGRKSRPDIFFSYGSAFAAGIFLGAGLVHMLADAMDGFSEATAELNYPLAPLLTAFGCVAVLFIEKILMVKSSSKGSAGTLNISGRASSYALIIVLSVYSILAGAALGADGTLLGSLVIFLAIFAHKGSASFSLAVDLHRGGIKNESIFTLILLFSLMTPLGVVIGLGFDAVLSSAGSRLVEAVLTPWPLEPSSISPVWI